jgi:hypothetical protein
MSRITTDSTSTSTTPKKTGISNLITTSARVLGLVARVLGVQSNSV